MEPEAFMIPAAFIIKDKDKIRLQTIDLTTMKRSILTTALVVLFASLAGSASAAAVPDQYHAMLSTYCFTCHSTRAKVGVWRWRAWIWGPRRMTQAPGRRLCANCEDI